MTMYSKSRMALEQARQYQRIYPSDEKDQVYSLNNSVTLS